MNIKIPNGTGRHDIALIMASIHLAKLIYRGHIFISESKMVSFEVLILINMQIQFPTGNVRHNSIHVIGGQISVPLTSQTSIYHNFDCIKDVGNRFGDKHEHCTSGNRRERMCEVHNFIFNFWMFMFWGSGRSCQSGSHC